jgi:hypothetical protein
LVACGTHTRAPVANRVEVANAAPDAGVAPVPEGCPASFDVAVKTGACTAGAPSCSYPEGSCYCGPTPVCSGMMRPADELDKEPVYWQCTAKPPLVRADGCPGSEPSGACSDEGKQCSYGSCCVTQVVCKGGQWQVGMAACPP